MAILKAETAKLGAAEAEGTDQTADKTTPGLYFGSTKVNNDFTVVDKVKAEAGGTATLFVKSGDDYVRVSTNVPGSVQGRALGTILDPKGKAIVNINKGEAFYGEVDILGKPYVTGYDGDLNRSTQHLLILLDKEVADGDVTDIVHGEAEG